MPDGTTFTLEMRWRKVVPSGRTQRDRTLCVFELDTVDDFENAKQLIPAELY